MKKSIISRIHIAFWFILLLTKTTSLFLPAASVNVPAILSLFMVMGFFNMLPFYLGYYSAPLLMDKTKRRKYVGLLILAGLLIPASIIAIALASHLTSYPPIIFINAFISAFISIVSFFLIGFGFRNFLNLIEQSRKLEELEKERLQSELALLRTQLSPHFLFNVLHNIDTLILSAPQKASEQLLKLSDLMRYTLYDANVNQIALLKEVDHLENYVALQKARLNNPKLIQYHTQGDFSQDVIAPMLLIPFVENCFKHVQLETGNPVTIELTVEQTLDGRQLQFHCSNPYDPTNQNKDTNSGIGLKTVEKRLMLIYPEKHRLKITKENRIFDVQLHIDLT
jgi:two-component system, LytTR family, sensor kinase